MFTNLSPYLSFIGEIQGLCLVEDGYKQQNSHFKHNLGQTNTTTFTFIFIIVADLKKCILVQKLTDAKGDTPGLCNNLLSYSGFIFKVKWT